MRVSSLDVFNYLNSLIAFSLAFILTDVNILSYGVYVV